MPAITATVQDTWPPRVLVSVTGLTVGDAVEVYRVVAGQRTLLRAGASASVIDPAFLRVDAELPFGVPVAYVAVVNGGTEYATSAVACNLPGGRVAVSDAITGDAAETVIMAWPDKLRERDNTVFRVGGRNVVVSGPMAGFTGDVEFYAASTSARDDLMDLLAAATEGVVQIRQPGGYDGVDSYVAVLAVTERRWSQDGSDPRRRILVQVAEVDAWAPALEARGATLQDIADAYTGTVPVASYSFASGVEGWAAVDGGTLAQVATPSDDGDGSLRFTPPGGMATLGLRRSSGTDLLPNAGTYTATAKVRSPLAWGDVRVVIDWFDAASSLISTSGLSGSSSILADAWTTLTTTAATSTIAVRARVRVRMSGTPGASNILYVDFASLVKELTIQDIANDYATLLGLAQGEFL
ncbi:hypothetical protein [Micromonospora sp. WMMD980]|uniref:hypothetical protein n=1 Tax=Micromonospora sp. WMMD980 TaxID=3016088 RepID=UPI002416BA20|nr:hypothetical protein [Micromonospora sp. WMMD980]MDG4799055.1 hypothetical protein [Micromonospora sp. WMMD980]